MSYGEILVEYQLASLRHREWRVRQPDRIEYQLLGGAVHDPCELLPPVEKIDAKEL